jgi:CspA family cold shock protein
MQGTVKKFDDQKGFGFIRPDDKTLPDCFVHYTGILGAPGRKSLSSGQRVEFDIQQESKGPRALNVRGV